MSLRDQIKEAEDLPFEDKDVPEWGVKLRVRGLSGTDRDAYEAEAVKLRGAGKSADMQLSLQNYRSRFLVKCLLDPETNERIYGDSPADIRELGSKSAAVLEPLFELAHRLSGMDKEADARAEGNSEADPGDASPTG